ncbi:Clavaminate synthase-like protein [Panus rudis PR-1116 ss-1]|nr:Clavaminate synthase-like protein [Panus rudis PR-1116 ss-1]
MASNFSSIPILDYSLASNHSTKPDFIEQLRHAVINVGFLYLSNTPVAREDIDAVIEYAPRVFDIPQEAKDKVRMANSPHFLGYSRFGAELTKGKTDQREQYDFATPWTNTWKPGDPEYLKLWGEPQWPDEELVPGFKETFLRYIDQVEKLSLEFIDLLAEAIGISPSDFDRFFNPGRHMQHRAKVVKYPVPPDSSSNQGVGPHFDGGFLTFLLQASPHRGLQVQNLRGDWIDAPPIPGTFVVNIGKALETVTRGLARATSHRVLSPKPGSTPRYSIPFFQNIRQDVRIGENVLDFKPEILKLKELRGEERAPDSVNYAEYGQLPSGEVALIGRVKSHPDVAQRHYPDLFKRFFPDGLPAQGFAY